MRVGILCGGGPAPGINSVISAATIEARNSGWDVVGILDGFEHLIAGDASQTLPLNIADVSRIHQTGGSILFTSRANPTVRDESAADPEWRLHTALKTLTELRVDALVTVGGDDTSYGAAQLAHAARASGSSLRVAHVPKTIDNDLPLPAGMPTFGFQTARHVGTALVSNLMTDAMTTKRWYFVVAMGRSAGHLALGIAKASGATIAVIGEEFPPGEVRLSHVVDILETSVLKRIAHGRPFGVAIIAEGLSLRFSQEDLLQVAPEVERDTYGNVRLAEVHLHRVLGDVVARRLKERGRKTSIVAKNIGYELRCAPPIPFDIAYTRDLGYGAVEYLRRAIESGEDEPGAMITIQEDHMVPLPFDALTDPATGKTRVRQVDLTSNSYRVSREYMIRLEPEDLTDPLRLDPIAAAANVTPDELRSRFGYLVGDEGAR
ncbi:MAG TPA: diphosphate--fructose-6-phosphate 1-phosphotransferase [Actinomycetota bacterium]|nr:diphosphate--fructose-6-phosphate 1-phosphotransferase [Actinomycetota bacterium]